LLILLEFLKRKGNESTMNSPLFLHLNCTFQHYSALVLVMTREHHSVIKMSLPRSQQRGFFFSPRFLPEYNQIFIFITSTLRAAGLAIYQKKAKPAFSPGINLVHSTVWCKPKTGDGMRIGILFPVVIFITAVVFLTWFFVGGYAAPGA